MSTKPNSWYRCLLKIRLNSSNFFFFFLLIRLSRFCISGQQPLKFYSRILNYSLSHARETQNRSSWAVQLKLWVQIELSDSIIESPDVLNHKNKQKSYICSSIWSVLNCLLWSRAPTFAWGGCSLLMLRGGNFLLHFLEHVCQVSTLPKLISNSLGRLDNIRRDFKLFCTKHEAKSRWSTQKLALQNLWRVFVIQDLHLKNEK